MASDPRDDDTSGDDDGRPSGQPNPFAGTPMEGMFAAFTGGGGMPDMNVLMGQMQSMFSPHEGSVNWTLATDVARHTTAAGIDPSPTAAEQGAVTDAVRLAELWLDRVTDLPAGARTSAAWSRAEWVESTMGTWRQLVEPIAEHVVAAMAQALPEQAKAMAGPLMGLLAQAGGAIFGQQVGQAVGGLANEVVSTTDVGLPLGPERLAAILPANVRAFGEGLDQSASDVLLYLAIRECAHHRLFANVPWLRSRLVGAIEEFGRGMTIDTSAIESQLGSLDPTDPAAISEALSGGLFEPQRTPAQQAALDRLEALLAFIEGWVDEVVGQATNDKMPAAPALREAVRRRRAAGGPAEQAFASLVGLELRPRQLREAAALWGSLRDRKGAAARDAVWAHPDLMPDASDLDDPLGFDGTQEVGAGADDGFDAALSDLLDDEARGGDHTTDTSQDDPAGDTSDDGGPGATGGDAPRT